MIYITKKQFDSLSDKTKRELGLLTEQRSLSTNWHHRHSVVSYDRYNPDILEVRSIVFYEVQHGDAIDTAIQDAKDRDELLSLRNFKSTVVNLKELLK